MILIGSLILFHADNSPMAIALVGAIDDFGSVRVRSEAGGWRYWVSDLAFEAPKRKTVGRSRRPDR